MAGQAVEVLDVYYLGITALVTFGMQMSFYAVAAVLKFDKVTDFAGGTNFVLNALLTLLLAQTFHWRQLVMTAMVVLWGTRLSSYLLYRIIKIGKDDRFDGIREDPIKFLVFWVFQIVWIWVVSLPVTLVNAVPVGPALQASDVAGMAMFAVGLTVEAVADQQKFAFKCDPSNRGKWCDVGLWRWSRHPNYFGEILLWWGIFTTASAVLRGPAPHWTWVCVASPLLTTALLMFVSGIPGLERTYDERFRGTPDYDEYKRRTSVLVPLPPALYGAMPALGKGLCCCEWPMYSAEPAVSKV